MVVLRREIGDVLREAEKLAKAGVELFDLPGHDLPFVPPAP